MHDVIVITQNEAMAARHPSIAVAASINVCTIARYAIHRAFFVSSGVFDCMWAYRVWHKALWSTMNKNNVSANLTRVIKQLYEKSMSAVLCNGNLGDWFRTSVGVRGVVAER